METALPVSPHPDKTELLTRYMAEHGLKTTRQRSLIIDTFFSLGGHLSVEELWAKVREQDVRVSVATVYRTMKLLHECGLAHARNFGDGQTRYEAAVGRHHHDLAAELASVEPSATEHRKPLQLREVGRGVDVRRRIGGLPRAAGEAERERGHHARHPACHARGESPPAIDRWQDSQKP